MKTKLLSAFLMILPACVFASEPVSTLDSTHDLIEFTQAFEADPDLAGKVYEVCVEGDCITIDRTVEMRKGGAAEQVEIKQSVAKSVADIVKSATSGMSGSASIKVTVTTSETKADGSSKTTSVNVEVTASGGKK